MLLGVLSPAKINLSLEVLGKGTDGYHEILTIFQTVEIADTLHFDWDAEEASVVCNDPDVPSGEENLVLKTVRAVERLLGFKVPLRVILEKSVPAGSGLGGGSSNAATVLLELAKKFEIPREQIRYLAASLGADVPFFLMGGTALGKGKGNVLEELPSLPLLPVVIVKPPFSISTREAYEKITEYSDGENTRLMVRAIRKGKFREALVLLTNDFEKVVFPVYPDLRLVKRIFLENGAAAAQLSGSGSALFAIAQSAEHARTLAEMVKPYGKTWVTRTLQA